MTCLHCRNLNNAHKKQRNFSFILSLSCRDYDSLKEEDAAQNAQLAFDMAEKEFGIKPFTTGEELASGQEPNKNSMVTYLSKFYELFRGTPLPPSGKQPTVRKTLYLGLGIIMIKHMLCGRPTLVMNKELVNKITKVQ